MSPISEFTNEIYDQDSLTDAFKEGADVWTIFLGVVVTLLPKVFYIEFSQFSKSKALVHKI